MKRCIRRGRTTVDGILNGDAFWAALEPDGQLSHWLQASKALLSAADADIGDMATFEITPAEQELEPEIPSDLRDALTRSPEALGIWDDTTTIACVDWIHWITSAKQAETRALRIRNACDMLVSGERGVCCFDSSGFHSKAFSAPKWRTK